MKTLRLTLLLFFLAQSFFSRAQFSYVYPLPDSKAHDIRTGIILRNGNEINRESLQKNNWIEITGQKSGKHNYTSRLSDDKKTIVIKPLSAFAFDETVSVTVHSAIEKKNGELVKGTSFSFSTRKEITQEELRRFHESDVEMMKEDFGYDPNDQRKKSIPIDSMAGFSITASYNPNDGQVFYCSQNQWNENNTNSLPSIINDNGSVVWTRDLGIDGHDFKINPGGFITYYNYELPGWIELDSNFYAVDTIQCGNGYADRTNGHDIEWYSDNHIFVVAYDNQTIDMSQIVAGGQVNATVKFPIVQELDSARDVVFEWRTQDHFQITDADVNTVITNGTVDFCHVNSMERDNDGNIIISSRNMCEVTKINHETGDIIWRMGGEHNQFSFVNDNIPEHFSYQHDVRRIANGSITMYNNGDYLSTQRSSAKEYSLDETNKVATLVWYYEHPDVNDQLVYGRAAGSVQRLPNGNTFIDWGNVPLFSNHLPNFTEVDANKNLIWELTFDTAVWVSFRAHKYVWNPCARVTSSTMAADVKFNKVTLSWAKALSAKQYELDYRKSGDTTWTVIISNKSRFVFTAGTLDPLTSYDWRVKTICANNPTVESGFTTIASFTTLQRLALNEQVAATGVSLFPNPCSNQLTISFSKNPPEELKVEVRNLCGVILLSENFQPQSTYSLDLETLAPGVYIVTISSSDGISEVPFVKE